MTTQILERATPIALNREQLIDLLDHEIHSKIRRQVEFLASEYEIKNPPEVADFLRENSFLLDILQEIPAQIRRYFGKEQKLILLYYFDPEDSSWNRLHIYIPTKLAVEEVVSKFDNFKENWWFDSEIHSESKIFINVRFVK